MNNSHHWGWIAFAFTVVFLGSWFFMMNRPTQDNNYGKGSTDASHTVTRQPLSIDLLNFSCQYIKPDGTPLKPGDKKVAKK